MTRIIIVALALLATAAPVATAMPSREYVSGAPTAAPQQDRRSADARDASVSPQAGASVRPQTGTAASGQDLRSVDASDAGTKPIAPASPGAAPITGGDDTSPFVYIVTGVLACVLLAVGMGYVVRASGRARRARIGT